MDSIGVRKSDLLNQEGNSRARQVGTTIASRVKNGRFANRPYGRL
jgi:hypothetical protein